jgi:tRNA-specific 2-thiouridylase
MKVLAALSGGVDSAVAAARAVDAGHEVTGVHLALNSNPQTSRSGSRGCCSLEDSRDARRVADVLGIPYYVWDFADQFRAEVVDDFLAEYAAGRTPNPCLRCNERIKFAAVLDRAVALGFDAVCTGHYAQIIDGPEGPELHRAVDPGKDQSYVLAVLDAEQIRRSIFPLGRTLKSDVRAEAASRGLLVADKPDSHDICFIADGDTKGFLAAHLGERPGVVTDVDGQVVGEHDGAFAFTVGQRRGLGLSVAAPDRRPRYVLSIEPSAGTVTVGPRSALAVRAIEADCARWCGGQPVTPGRPTRLTVQYRAHGETVGAAVSVSASGHLTAALDEPALGVAPGQTLALYDGARVLGSATITGTVAESPA